MVSRVFKAFAIMVSVTAIEVSPAAADGGPTLPKPTGDYAVGRVTYHLVDMARQDEWGSHKDHKREFMVQVWYPAPSGSKGKPAPWLPAEWARLEENAIIGRPLQRSAKEVGDFLASVVSHAQEGVPLASSPKRFPVILLAPGSLSFPSEYSSFAEDLASHGFVVVGDVATGNVAAVSFPAGNVTRTYKGKDIFAEWAGDLIYEMDQLEVWNKTEGHLFFGRLDLDHIGAFGHSAGGMIVSRIPHMDKRVKAIALNDPGIADVLLEERRLTARNASEEGLDGGRVGRGERPCLHVRPPARCGLPSSRTAAGGSCAGRCGRRTSRRAPTTRRARSCRRTTPDRRGPALLPAARCGPSHR